MFGLGAGELLLIFVIAVVFLGPKKLPELAKGLGQAMKEFQKARDEVMSEIQKSPETKKVEDSNTIVAEAKPVEVMEAAKVEADSKLNS